MRIEKPSDVVVRPRRVGWGAALLLLGAAGMAAAAGPAVLELTMEHFRDTAGVTVDPGTGTITVTTEAGFVQRSGPLRMVWNDEFLQGVIDRNTGQITYQVVVVIIYKGEPRAYPTATFNAPDGPHSEPVTVVHRSVELCATGDCTYTDRLTFTVDATVLTQLAAGGNAPARLWHFTVQTRRGPRYQGALSTAEIAGLLAKVDAVARNPPPAAPLPTPTPAAAPATTPQRDLGIDGIEVAGGAEQPQRAGILIAGVRAGSVAQRTGLIVGDILYDYDGHAVKTLAELQAAVSAAAARSPVALRVFRGTNSVQMEARF